MNLTEQYEQIRKKEFYFRGIKLTPLQIKLLKTLREKARTGDLVIPEDEGYGRGSGKTTVLVKLAEELGAPLIEPNLFLANELQKRYPGVPVYSASEVRSRLMDAPRTDLAIIDEGVDPMAVLEVVPRITGVTNHHIAGNVLMHRVVHTETESRRRD